ncbi:ISL3 family transposase [Enterococcus sp. DIV0187]|uniref:ISL3 family transposase n=1 Tax=Enterococcus sp. DIV0187 TaxID=2774644 RepID=UPI003F266211
MGKKKIHVDYDVAEICIDDFALKKRQRYGTIMVDIKTGKIVDLLESREKEDVIEWLKKFKCVELVSRDGSRTYSAAIKKAFPHAIQVTDRFHLVARLCELAQTFMRHSFPPRIPIEISNEKYEKFEDFLLYASRRDKIVYVKRLHTDGMTQQEIRMKTGFGLKTISKYIKMKEKEIPEDKAIFWERHHNELMEEKQQQIDEVRALAKKGVALSEITDITGYTPQTIVRYLGKDASSLSGQYGIDRPGKLEKYRKEVLALRKERKTYSEIFQIISEKGYTGTVDAIRGYMSRQRRLHKHFKEEYQGKSIEILERKWLIKLFYLPIEKVPVIDSELLELVFNQHPKYKQLYELVWRFRDGLKKQDLESFKSWMSSVKENFDDVSLLKFVGSLLNDFLAVKYAITHKYNNGLAEGSVNKIKTIKKQMYGRCSFNLLRKKVLSLENRRIP